MNWRYNHQEKRMDREIETPAQSMTRRCSHQNRHMDREMQPPAQTHEQEIGDTATSKDT